MPTLNNPSGRIKIPTPLAGVSTRGPATTDDKVLSLISPAAADGNSVLDHLSDIKAELGHRTDDDEFKGEYSASATYAIGDEVSWTDGAGKKRFYKRITAGDDGGNGNPSTNTDAWIVLGANIHDIASGDYTLTTNASLLERLPNGTIRFNRRGVTALMEAITSTQATTIASTEVQRVIQNRLWHGVWAVGSYTAGQFVKHGSDYFLCIQSVGSSTTTTPDNDSTHWRQLTVNGYHYDIARRLEDITGLLAERMGLVPASSNRGRWMSRRSDNEGYAYDNPPMQWVGNWSSGTSYFFGHVVNHDTRVWVLSASSTITTPKRGSSTEPGTDSAWTQIIVGHTSDVPGWRGAWVDLAGASIRQGDVVTHRGNYYIARVDLSTRPANAPDKDETNWDLLDIVLGEYDSDEYYPAGGIVKYEGNWWYSTEYVANTDPDPGEANNTKWLQVGGYATTADIEQLRRDIHDLSHGARTSRGVLVDALEEPPTTDSESLVWLPRKTIRSYQVPASLVSGSSAITENVGDEPGQYKLTSGTINHARGVIGKYTDPSSNYVWYGILARAEDGADWANDVGRWIHNPVGSAIIGVGVEQRGASSWFQRILVKNNVMRAIGGNANLDSFEIRLTKSDGTNETAAVSTRSNIQKFHDVDYGYWHSEISGRGVFGNIYEAASNEAERTVDVSIVLTTNGDPRWLGNRQYGWTRQPPDASSDDTPVYSTDVHTIQVISRTDYQDLLQLPPRTILHIYENA